MLEVNTHIWWSCVEEVDNWKGEQIVCCSSFLASQDAIEVMFVTTLLSVSTDLSYVTLVSDDTYGDEDEDDEDEEDEEDEED